MSMFCEARTLVIGGLAATLMILGCQKKSAPEPVSPHEEPPKPPAEAIKPAEPAPTPAPAPEAEGPLMAPAKLTETAPEVFKAAFDTSKGAFTIEVQRAWAPNGADRFYNLVKNGFYDGVRFFRVIDGFMAQFGINGDPKVNAVWRDANIPDDPGKESNKKGFLSFAMAGPGTRTTQVFINLVDNSRLDSMGFSPFGKVTKGMDVVEKLHAGYGEGAPRGMGPDQMRLQMQGNPYLEAEFPKLDHVKTAKIVK